MQKTESMTRNNDFRRLYAKGKSLVDRNFVIYYSRNRIKKNRLGLTVSVKIGNAVVRSRCKRLLRESYRLLEHNLPTGYDFVLVARGRLPFVKCPVVTEAMGRLLSKEGLLVSAQMDKNPQGGQPLPLAEDSPTNEGAPSNGGLST